MTVNPETIVIGILSAMIVALGGVLVAQIAARTNREANAVNFSKTLIDRLSTVESKVDELENQLTASQRALQAAVRFIDRLVSWGRTGGTESMPEVPPVLHDYLDQDMWTLPKHND